MKKHMILAFLGVLFFAGLTFAKDNSVKYCKVEIALTEQVSAEDVMSLAVGSGTEVQKLSDPERVVADILQEDVKVLIEAGIKVKVLDKYVLYSGQSLVSQQSTTGDLTPISFMTSVTDWYINDTYYGIPDYYSGGGSACSIIDMSNSFDDEQLCRIDIKVGLSHNSTEFLVGTLSNESSSTERIVFDRQNFFVIDVTGIKDFVREPIAQKWRLCVEEVCNSGLCGWGQGGILEWWIRFHYGAPENDSCTTAKVISKDVTYDGLTDFASGESLSRCVVSDGNDVWFVYTPTESGMATISTQGSSFDTTLTVYDNCMGNELACNDDACGNFQSQITMYVELGNSYYVRLAGYNGDVGDYAIRIEQISCVIPSPATNPQPYNGQEHVLTEDLTLIWNADVAAGSQSFNDEPQVESQKIIYGSDSRKDAYEVTDIGQKLTMKAVAAIFNQSAWNDNGDGTLSLSPYVETLSQWYLRTDPLGTGHGLCSAEPFIDQFNPALGAAVLVANDIVATSGSCTQLLDLENMAFVFGFKMQDSVTTVTLVDSSQVYYADHIIASQIGSPDWALIKLDRPVTGYTPLSIRRDGQVSNGQPLYSVGHPLGLPKKVTDQAIVKDNTVKSYFLADIDSYSKSSGSAVVNPNTLMVEGILVHDDNDADFEADITCDHSIQCSGTSCPDGEFVTRTTEFASLVPLPAEMYDIYLDTQNPPQDLFITNTTTNSFKFSTITELNPYVTYYWQVVSKNQCGNIPGPIWSFTTTAFVDDYNEDKIVDNKDLSLLAEKWLQSDQQIDLNYDPAYLVNFEDFAIFAQDWLKTYP